MSEIPGYKSFYGPTAFNMVVRAGAVAVVLLSGPVGVATAQQGPIGKTAETTTGQVSLEVTTATATRAPDDIARRLAEEAERKDALIATAGLDDLRRPYIIFKDKLYEQYGLSFGLFYTALYQTAWNADSLLGSGTSNASGGIGELLGKWELIGRGTEHPGLLAFRIQDRHRYGAITPQELGLQIGSLWPTAIGFNEFDLSAVELYWEQHIIKDRVAFRIGKMIPFAIHDYFKMKSPTSGFTNATFTLNPSIAWVGFGLGATVLLRPQDDFYVLAGTYDANGQPTTSGFDTLFREGELLTIVDLGWDPGYINKRNKVQLGPFTVSEYHLTLWHRDAMKKTGTPSGWGATLSLENTIGNVLTFFRYGYSKGTSAGSPAILNNMVATGIGIEQPFDRKSDLIGFGVSWGDRDLGTAAIDLNADDVPDQVVLGGVNQWAAELFYRLQATQELQVTPSVQLNINPNQNLVGVFGVRARVEF